MSFSELAKGIREARLRCSHCRRKLSVAVLISELLETNTDSENLEVMILSRQQAVVDKSHFEPNHGLRWAIRLFKKSLLAGSRRATVSAT
jgi:hypothetical protein